MSRRQHRSWMIERRSFSCPRLVYNRSQKKETNLVKESRKLVIMIMNNSTSEFDKAVRRCIPAEFMLISAAQDDTEAQEAYNAGRSFGLPNADGKAGSACISTFLKFLYDKEKDIKDGQVTWSHALKEMQRTLEKSKMGDGQEFQLSSSRPIIPSKTFQLVPVKSGGRRRALLIGIKYTGQPNQELRSPHNDCKNIRDALVNLWGFSKKDIVMLQDDGKKNDTQPTKSNILSAFAKLVQQARAGDVYFIGYSGHGGQIKNRDGTEESGYDSTIIPVDWKTSGHIIDDQILTDLVKAMPKGVNVSMLMDCCHSASVADLPYSMGVRDKIMKVDQMFNTDTPEEMRAKIEAEKLEKQAKKAAKKAAKQKEYDNKVARIKQFQAQAAAQPIPVVEPTSLPTQLQGLTIQGSSGNGAPQRATMMQMPMQIPAGSTVTIDSNGQPLINGKHMKLPHGAVVTSAVMHTGEPVQIPSSVINGTQARLPVVQTKPATRRVVQK